MDLKDSHLIQKLRGGDRRSIGRVPEVVREVTKKPELAGELVVGIVSDDPIIRMRAADALEKVSKERPALLSPRGLLSSLKPVIENACRHGSPAMRSRGRKLLSILG